MQWFLNHFIFGILSYAHRLLTGSAYKHLLSSDSADDLTSVLRQEIIEA
jgi:hypothetical protein